MIFAWRFFTGNADPGHGKTLILHLSSTCLMYLMTMEVMSLEVTKRYFGLNHPSMLRCLCGPLLPEVAVRLFAWWFCSLRFSLVSMKSSFLQNPRPPRSRVPFVKWLLAGM
jgi:hypothetical protein